MTYSIKIIGMRCTGCSSLITMTLEDIGFSKVSVDLKNQNTKFSSNLDLNLIKEKLTEVFKDFKEYKYSDLEISK